MIKPSFIAVPTLACDGGGRLNDHYHDEVAYGGQASARGRPLLSECG
jgi:hypothetical protein